MNDNNKNKLSKETFAYGMEYLNAYYTSLKIDLDNELVQNVWYEAFGVCSDDDFVNMIVGYCKNNVYPPQSPTHLYDYLKNMALRSELSGDEAWGLGYELVRAHGFNVKKACDDMNGKGYHAMAATFSKLSSRFYGLNTDELPYLKRDWKEQYAIELNAYLQNKVKEGLIESTKYNILLENNAKENE